MLITTDDYRAWFATRGGDPAQKQLATNALEAFERAVSGGALTAEDLAAVTEAAADRRQAVCELGVDLLLRLTVQFVEAQAAVRNLMSARKVHQRLQLVFGLRVGPPPELMREIILRGLDDPGYRVRLKAAEACDRLRLAELIPQLEHRLSVETDPRVRHALTFHAAMLRDGYFIEWHGEEPRLFVRTVQGWTLPPFSRRDLDAGRLRAVIAETRAGSLRMPAPGRDSAVQASD